MIPAITINAYMNPTSKSYNLKCSHQKAGGLRLRLFLCLYHLLAAVDAQDVYFFGGSHAVAAAGANIFAVVAVAGRGWAFAAARRVAAARAPRGVAPLNAVHADVRPPLRQNDSHRASVGWVMLHPMRGSCRMSRSRATAASRNFLLWYAPPRLVSLMPCCIFHRCTHSCSMVATTFSMGLSSVPAPMFSSCRVLSPRCHALATVTWP